MPLLKYDMPEYSEKHIVSALIGPPPGYVGFGDSQVQGGRLISDLSKNPHAIMLFDEVEKAHPDIFNIFLASVSSISCFKETLPASSM